MQMENYIYRIYQKAEGCSQDTNTPFLTAPAGVQYFIGVRPGVTGVQLRLPGCTEVTMKSDGVHPSQPEIKNLVGVEVLALKSDWGALQAHEKFHWGWHKLSIFHWGLRSIASGLHYFLNFSGVHPDAPRCTPEHPGAPRPGQ